MARALDTVDAVDPVVAGRLAAPDVAALHPLLRMGDAIGPLESDRDGAANAIWLVRENLCARPAQFCWATVWPVLHVRNSRSRREAQPLTAWVSAGADHLVRRKRFLLFTAIIAVPPVDASPGCPGAKLGFHGRPAARARARRGHEMRSRGKDPPRGDRSGGMTRALADGRGCRPMHSRLSTQTCLRHRTGRLAALLWHVRPPVWQADLLPAAGLAMSGGRHRPHGVWSAPSVEKGRGSERASDGRKLDDSLPPCSIRSSGVPTFRGRLIGRGQGGLRPGPKRASLGVHERPEDFSPDIRRPAWHRDMVSQDAQRRGLPS